MRRDSGLTKDLLHRISKKLSGRKDCKHVEYCVVISNGTINMSPYFRVFTDLHHRKKLIDEHDVAYYVLNQMHEIFKFKDTDLVDGIYVYKYYRDINRRKWIGLL